VSLAGRTSDTPSGRDDDRLGRYSDGERRYRKLIYKLGVKGRDMSEESTASGWFQDVDPGDADAVRDAVEHGSADHPADWPGKAVASGFADDESEYYTLLHDATVNATREVVRERERADDQQLKHGVRAMDDKARNLL
jgi:RNA processing factor Prp31